MMFLHFLFLLSVWSQIHKFHVLFVRSSVVRMGWSWVNKQGREVTNIMWPTHSNLSVNHLHVENRPANTSVWLHVYYCSENICKNRWMEFSLDDLPVLWDICDFFYDFTQNKNWCLPFYVTFCYFCMTCNFLCHIFCDLFLWLYTILNLI